MTSTQVCADLSHQTDCMTITFQLSRFLVFEVDHFATLLQRAHTDAGQQLAYPLFPVAVQGTRVQGRAADEPCSEEHRHLKTLRYLREELIQESAKVCGCDRERTSRRDEKCGRWYLRQ